MNIDPIMISQKVIIQLYTGVSTSELDELASQIASSLVTLEPDYGILATNIIISNNHKNTLDIFSDKINLLYNNTDNDNIHNPLVSKMVYDVVNENKIFLQFNRL